MAPPIRVLCLYLGYAAGLVFCALTLRGTLSSTLGTGLSAIAALGALIGLVGLIQSRRTPLSGFLDERQQSVRDRGYSMAYRALGIVVVFSALFLGLAYFGEFTTPGITRREVVLLLFGVLLLVLTLPSATMEWTEPDPPEDSGA